MFCPSSKGQVPSEQLCYYWSEGPEEQADGQTDKKGQVAGTQE